MPFHERKILCTPKTSARLEGIILLKETTRNDSPGAVRVKAAKLRGRPMGGYWRESANKKSWQVMRPIQKRLVYKSESEER